MDISDSESEDGQISKLEQEEERFLNLTSGVDPRSGKGRAGKDKEDLDAPCSMADLETCRLTREDIVKHYVKPWFQDFVTGEFFFFGRGWMDELIVFLGFRSLGKISYWTGNGWIACVSNLSNQ